MSVLSPIGYSVLVTGKFTLTIVIHPSFMKLYLVNTVYFSENEVLITRILIQIKYKVRLVMQQVDFIVEKDHQW